MRGLCLYAAVFLTLSAATSATTSRAADPTPPVTVQVSPKAGVPGVPVVIKGTSGIDVENATTLKVTVVPPWGGKTVTLTPAISKEGAFQVTYTDTKETGKYTVTAVSPGGFGKGTATFSILPPASAMQEYEKELQALFPVSQKAMKRVTKIVDSFPASTDKEEVKKKADALQKKLDQIEQQTSLVKTTQPLLDHLAKVPEHGERVALFFKRLDAWSTESEEERVRINAELIKSAEEGEDCEQIDKAIEALNLVSFLMNLIAGPFDIVKGFAVDWLASEGGSDAGAVASKVAVNLADAQATATLAHVRGGKDATGMVPSGKVQPQNVTLTGLGLAFDLSNLLAKGYYGKRCERLEGPMTAKMIGKVSKDGKEYWSFSITLKGKLVLRYAKAEPGTAIRVHGQFMGFGTDFTTREDMVSVLFPDVLAKTRATTFHRVTTPSVNIALNEWNSVMSTQGVIAQTLASPTSFYIPVEGDIVKDKLTLHIKPARFDFNEEFTSAQAVYVLLSPIAIAPYVIVQKLPYHKAHFIVTRALDAEVTNTVEMKVVVDSKKKRTSVGGKFDRDFKNETGDTTAKYTLDVKACTPSCD